MGKHGVLLDITRLGGGTRRSVPLRKWSEQCNSQVSGQGPLEVQESVDVGRQEGKSCVGA